MENEFRFWDHIAKEWTVIKQGIITIHNYYPIFIFPEKSKESPIDITQSIGFKDIDDKKIFVGDWLERKDEGELFLIQFDGIKLYARRYMPDYRCYCENCMNDENRCWTYEDLDLFYAIHNSKIVGNEFENPNLHETFYKEKS